MSNNEQNNTAAKIEEITNKLQEYGTILPGQVKFFAQFLTANAGLVGSVGDLVQKIGNETAKSSDYIDVAKDISDVGIGALGMINPLFGERLNNAKDAAFIILDYADAHSYDVKEIKDDLGAKFEDAKKVLADYLSENTKSPETTTPVIDIEKSVSGQETITQNNTTTGDNSGYAMGVSTSSQNQITNTTQYQTTKSYLNTLNIDDTITNQDGSYTYLSNNIEIATAKMLSDDSVSITTKDGFGIRVYTDGTEEQITPIDNNTNDYFSNLLTQTNEPNPLNTQTNPNQPKPTRPIPLRHPTITKPTKRPK